VTDDGGEDDTNYCKIGGCDREQHVDSKDGMCLPCGVAYESGWHDCFDEKVRGVRGRQEIKRRREKANIRINNLYKTDAKIEREDIIEETLDWVLGGVTTYDE